MEISLKALTQIRLDSNKVSYNLIQVFWRKKSFSYWTGRPKDVTEGSKRPIVSAKRTTYSILSSFRMILSRQ